MDCQAVAAARRPIYAIISEHALEEFTDGPRGASKYPMNVAASQRALEGATPLFAFPPHIRRVIYAMYAIDNLSMPLRKTIKTRDHFPTDEPRSNCYGWRYRICWLNPRGQTSTRKTP